MRAALLLLLGAVPGARAWDWLPANVTACSEVHAPSSIGFSAAKSECAGINDGAPVSIAAFSGEVRHAHGVAAPQPAHAAPRPPALPRT